jgi:hypothetical protein
MAKFRKKPVVIEAMQWNGMNQRGIEEWAGIIFAPDLSDRLAIFTLEGKIYASVGDWIIKGVKGEFYPCKPDIFEATYEPIE